MSVSPEQLWRNLLGNLEAYATGCASYAEYHKNVRTMHAQIGAKLWVSQSPIRRVPLLYATLHAEGEVDEYELGVEGARNAAQQLRNFLDVPGEVREWFGPGGRPVAPNTDEVVAPVRICIEWAHQLRDTPQEADRDEIDMKIVAPPSRLQSVLELLGAEEPSVLVRLCADFVRAMSAMAPGEKLRGVGGDIYRRRSRRLKRAARRLVGLERFLARVVFRMSRCQLYLSATDSGLVGGEPWN